MRKWRVYDLYMVLKSGTTKEIARVVVKMALLKPAVFSSNQQDASRLKGI